MHSFISKSGDAQVRTIGIDLDQGLIERAKENVVDGVQFFQLDIMSDKADVFFASLLKTYNRTRFDLITCFSVSMWIHLNHGDDGLRIFIQKLSTYARYLLLEPQPWRCYQTAARRMRKLKQPEFEHLSEINYRCEQLRPFTLKLCKDHNLVLVQNFGSTDWKREVIFFRHALEKVPSEVGPRQLKPLTLGFFTHEAYYILGFLAFVACVLMGFMCRQQGT